MEIAKEDLWIRTYGRLYQKLCSTSCEIPIGIYRTQEMASDETPEGFGTSRSEVSSPTGTAGEDSLKQQATGGGGGRYATDPPPEPTCPNIRAISQSLPHLNVQSMRGLRLRTARTCLGACGSHESSYLSLAVGALEEPHSTKDTHVQLIERAEIASLIRSRMQSLGLPHFGDAAFHFSERRSSFSYVILNPSCDLKLKEGDVIYLIKPSPFSAQKTFERHNSRRKSTLSYVSLNGEGASGQPLGFNLFAQPTNLTTKDRESRRRSSSGSLYTPSQQHSPRQPVTKSNSLSLPDSPNQRPRSNSLRPMNVTDDILVRRCSSLRQGLGLRRPSSHEELGLPSTFTAPTRPVRLTLNGGIGFEITPPEDTISSTTSLNLPGTIV